MYFEEALEQMRKGRVVARRYWDCFARNEGVAICKHATRDTIAFTRDGKWVRRWALISHEDLLANDWENVEATVPTHFLSETPSNATD